MNKQRFMTMVDKPNVELNMYLDKKSPSASLFPSEFFKKVGEEEKEK